MGNNNTVAIISNSEFITEQIKNMLVLLRDIDKVETCDYFGTEDMVRESAPNVIILYAGENDKSCFKLLKRIRGQKGTKEIPVILCPEYENSDFVIEAFDSGATDILNPPLKDYELVIRVIWAIQKSETAISNETKESFLRKIKVIDENTGFFNKEYSKDYLESLVSRTRENKQKACLMYIKLNSPLNNETEKNDLVEAIKKSVRLNDVIVSKEENSYFVFLSKSKINGVYSVYERILAGLAPLTSISSSALEIDNRDLDEMMDELISTSDKKSEKGGIVIIKKDGITTTLEEEKKIQEANKVMNEKAELGATIVQEKVRNFEREKGELKIRKLFRKKASNNKQFNILRPNNELKETDERNAVLYKQAWAKKLNMIAEPLLKKYASKFQNKYKLLDANLNVDPYLTFLYLEKNDIKLNFKMRFEEPKTIRLNLSITVLESEVESETLKFEVTEFDFEKLNIILKTITDEYEQYIRED